MLTLIGRLSCLALSALAGAASAKSTAPAGFSFDKTGVSSRLLTPNGDGLNDAVTFTFANPRGSAVNGRVYDAGGSLVSNMLAVDDPQTALRWDGKAGGRAVASGVYIYVIESEDKVYTGTVAVIR